MYASATNVLPALCQQLLAQMLIEAPWNWLTPWRWLLWPYLDGLSCSFMKKYHSKQITVLICEPHAFCPPCPGIAPVGTSSYELCVCVVVLQDPRIRDHGGYQPVAAECHESKELQLVHLLEEKCNQIVSNYAPRWWQSNTEIAKCGQWTRFLL